MSRMDDLVTGGGVKRISYTVASAPRSDPQGQSMLTTCGNLHLRARHHQTHQSLCAEAIATMDNLSSRAWNEPALVSQQLAGHAIRTGCRLARGAADVWT